RLHADALAVPAALVGIIARGDQPDDLAPRGNGRFGTRLGLGRWSRHGRRPPWLRATLAPPTGMINATSYGRIEIDLPIAGVMRKSERRRVARTGERGKRGVQWLGSAPIPIPTCAHTAPRHA